MYLTDGEHPGIFEAASKTTGTPIQQWDTSILSWSMGYWLGKVKTGCRYRQRRQFQKWADEAHAELLARKLRE